MLKKRYLISFILLLFIFFCFFIKPNDIFTNISINSKYDSSKPIELPIAKIVINDINLNRNIYNINSKENNVDKNIQLLNGSVFPNNDNDSIIFLAAHSGNSSVSYFNNLYQLKRKKIINLYYNNYNYYYEVYNVFSEKKDGDIEINRIFDDQLVLTTCDPINKDKQLILICNLLKKEKV